MVIRPNVAAVHEAAHTSTRRAVATQLTTAHEGTCVPKIGAAVRSELATAATVSPLNAQSILGPNCAAVHEAVRTRIRGAVATQDVPLSTYVCSLLPHELGGGTAATSRH